MRVSLYLEPELRKFFLDYKKKNKIPKLSDAILNYMSIDKDVCVDFKTSAHDKKWIGHLQIAFEIMKYIELFIEFTKGQTTKKGYTDVLNIVKSSRIKLDMLMDKLVDSEIGLSLEEQCLIADAANTLILAMFEGSQSFGNIKKLNKVLAPHYNEAILTKDK